MMVFLLTKMCRSLSDLIEQIVNIMENELKVNCNRTLAVILKKLS